MGTENQILKTKTIWRSIAQECEYASTIELDTLKRLRW